MQYASRVKRAETEETNRKDSWPRVIYCRRSPILVPIWGHQMQMFCITEELNKQSEFRNDISTECISRHILYEQYRKSLHEKKVMVSVIANTVTNFMWYKNITGRFFGLVTMHVCCVTDRRTDRITTPKTALA